MNSVEKLTGAAAKITDVSAQRKTIEEIVGALKALLALNAPIR